MTLAVLSLTLALRLSSRAPAGITQHTIEAFSVFQYCTGVHEITLDFETTQRELHRVSAKVHMPQLDCGDLDMTQFKPAPQGRRSAIYLCLFFHRAT